MDLRTFLRQPIFIHKMTNLDKVSEQIKTKEYAYVFLKTMDNIYPMKSCDLLLEEQETFEKIIQRLGDEPPLNIIPFADLASRVLDVLSASVTLVLYENDLKYILREDFLQFMKSSSTDNDTDSDTDSAKDWLKGIFAPNQRGLMIVDLNYAVVNSNAEALRILRIPRASLENLRMDQLLGLPNFQNVYNTQKCLINHFITIPSSQAAITVDFVPLMMNQLVIGFALVLQDHPTIEKVTMELDTLKQLNIDLVAILSSSYDEIVIVDASGKIIRASNHYISSLWTHPPNTLIGQQILELKMEDELIYKVICEVQKKKQRISLMSNNKYPSLSVGIPIFHKSGQLERIVIASRELKDESRLQQELEQTRKQSDDYRRELEQLRERVTKVNGILPVYASTSMHEIMKEIERVAKFSATILLTGESGAGKEIFANAIHALSERRNQPLIKINCAAIPENLLESELFGYQRGAFSGANQEGKTGLIVKAHKGCLFLDEISELPPVIQGKLLRAIQEREVYPVGATEPIKFDIQIIAATNRPLAQLVAQGKFREDLYYRINVLPIEIPPLRERIEDIALLANNFLAQFNQIYQRNLRFSSQAIELLEAYSFPGNVRELQNLIQRIAIKNEGDVIEAVVVERILMQCDTGKSKKAERFKHIVPLEQAFAQVEEELVTMAMKQYHSTTKAAKALGVSQATVSRKYRQIINKLGMQQI